MASPAIEVHDLTVAYRTQPVLWDVDLALPEGKLIAIVGPNGAGKSTLLKAIFVESSVPRRSIEAVQAAVRSQEREVAIGGQLYSDALGAASSPAGTYAGMVRANVDTIVNALK